MKLKKLNPEVFLPVGNPVRIDNKIIVNLKKKADASIRKRTRINAHEYPENPVQEMFIIHKKGAYIRPHKHLKKLESLHIIEGSATVVFYSDKGKITGVFNVGDYKSGHTFYYKLKSDAFHSLLITSEYFVFVETANGPFRQDDRIDAPWSPVETDTRAVSEYLAKLSKEANKYK